jgi:hypothetical protein
MTLRRMQRCALICSARQSPHLPADSSGFARKKLGGTTVPNPLLTRRFPHEQMHGPCRDRTCDLGIKSPLLYQLS